MKAKNPGRFTIKASTESDHGYSYRTFTVCGYLKGERVRRQFKDHELGPRREKPP